MNKPSSVLLACAAFALLAGCQKTPEPKTSDVTSGAPSITPSSSSASQSVALPANQMPPSDAAIAPQAAAAPGTSGSANTPTQANPVTLTEQQEKTTLPHSGQVNNHSVPETTGEKKQ
ncbi:hypothetical protein RY831_07340 [Noviherbaspirillum sp. CPCC 100848]|uniref:Lipoprotein n=1 Tax=Noviherbaspirillum album TaxID=3080276 RepID=A0ABU6J5N0_9BURK|nr:hypothetical protein [Noviherbaspirillum sp. CPCC 100848]MEC4718955.1 hypothetical protein [Noviherbaspirillum sp. CPCC 100848]